MKNNIRLSSIEIFRSDSQISTLDISKSQEYYNSGVYSVPYYLKPRECLDWTVKSGDELWLFRLNHIIDINYIQIVLHSKQNLQNILFANRRQALKLIINTSSSADLLCQLLRQSYKRNYLTLDYNCGSQESLNHRLESIVFEYRNSQSFKPFALSLCELRVYEMPIDCGSPDYTLSTTAANQTQDVFTFNCKDNNHVIDGKFDFLNKNNPFFFVAFDWNQIFV